MDDITRRYQHALRQTRQTVSRHAAAVWHNLPDYNRPSVALLTGQVLPVVLAGQRQAVALTQGYMAHRLGTPIHDVDIDKLVGTYARNGADPSIVYERPFVAVWGALKAGVDYGTAITMGLDRLTGLASEDVALSARDTAGAITSSDPNIVGWERVPDDSACDFCLMASTQRYHSEDLMDLHNNCGCTVEPLTGDGDPGQVIHPQLLDELKGRQVDASTYQHGELGPVLSDGADESTSSADLIGSTAADWALWAVSQNWEITSTTADRIEAVRDGTPAAWEPYGSTWRIAA